MRSTSSVTALSGGGLWAATTNVWLVFALVTALFVASALVQLVRPSRPHRP